MPEAREREVVEGELDPREVAQLLETTGAKTVSDLDQLTQSAGRYRTSLTGGGGEPAPPPSYQDDLIQTGRAKIAEYEQAIARERGAREDRSRQMGPQYEQTAKDIESMPMPEHPQVPTPPPIPRREQYVDQTAARSLFAVASAIAALGMAGGRGRGMLAMSGITGAMQGFQEGNAERYKSGMAQYKEAVNEQIEQYKMMRQDYLDVLQARGMTIEEKMRALQLRAKPLEDKVADSAAEVKDFDKLLKHIGEVGKMTVDFQRIAQDAELFPLQKELMSAQAEHLRRDTRTGKSPTKEEYELMLERRKGGAQTGNPLVDSLSPEEAARRLNRTSGQDDKPAPAGNYFNKDTGAFDPAPTRGEVRSGNYVKMSNQDKQAVEFLFNALDQIPQIKALADKALSNTGLIGAPGQYLSSKTSALRGSESAQILQEFKQRASTIKLEATRLETGTSRVIGAVLHEVSQQIPDAMTNRENAKRQLDTLANTIKIRLRAFMDESPNARAGLEGVGNYPSAVNPQTGEKMIYKDGKWQKP